MKKTCFLLFFIFLALFVGLAGLIPTKISAQEFTEPLFALQTENATSSANSTESAKLASPSAEIVEKIQEKKDQDITETTGKQKSKLAAYLDNHPIGPFSWNNFIQHAIRQAIENGLAANIVVLMILFPVLATIIAASRHVVGLKGFGIYTPAVLSVAFVSTGIVTGVSIFIAVLLSAIVSRKLVKKLKLPYLPRTAMLLLGVSFVSLMMLIGASMVDIAQIYSLISINIFPLLIIILLTENFMESQLFSSQKEALRLTLETLLIAVICALFINLESVQQFVLLQPELTFLVMAFVNLLLGKYTGLRLLEYIRFKSVLDKS